MTQEQAAAAPAAERMEMQYQRLDWLLGKRFEDNPKLHARDLIEHSIRVYGFNNPVLMDYSHDMLVAGHGRLEQLEGMMFKQRNGMDALRELQANPGIPANIIASYASSTDLKLPRNIATDEDGMWLVPTISSHFASVEQAIQFLLMDNRTASMSYRQEDYDAARMKRALSKAVGTLGQDSLPGFEDIGAGELAQFLLPDSPGYVQYDGTSVPGAPAYAPNIKESYVLLIACPTQEDMRRTLFYLSCGTRRTLRESVKHTGMDATQWFEKWAVLVGNAELPPNTPEQAAEAMQPAAGVEGEVTPVDQLTEPTWNHGLCVACGGGGSVGRRTTLTGAQENIMCVACEGAGDRLTWIKMKGGEGLPAAPVKRTRKAAAPAAPQLPLVEPEFAIAPTPEPEFAPPPTFEIGD